MGHYKIPKFMEQSLRRIAKPVLEEGQEEFGLGDVVHGATRRAGIKHCSDCTRRKKGMNRRFRFGRRR